VLSKKKKNLNGVKTLRLPGWYPVFEEEELTDGSWKNIYITTQHPQDPLFSFGSSCGESCTLMVCVIGGLGDVIGCCVCVCMDGD